jgi:dCMP deaminase
MKSRESWDNFFMALAHKTSELSYDDLVKVGCIITKGENIISFSYNGTPRGTSNVMRDTDGKTREEVLHAEANALLKVARSNESTEGATLYSTLSPCKACAKMIYQAGIRRLVYKKLYKDDESIVDWLKDLGVLVTRIQ